MFGQRYDLFTLFGFRIRIDRSWFIFAILVTWSLAEGFFPFYYEGLSPATYWWMGAAGALGLFGSIVLHVTPESAAGGPLALVKSGDRIRLDVQARKLELLIGEAELTARRKNWKKPAAAPEDSRGYRKLFLESVTQADRGCDFDFCVPEAKIQVPRSKS